MTSRLRSTLALAASFAVFAPLSASAQGGPDASGYLWSPTAYDFVVLNPANGGAGTVVGPPTGSSQEFTVTLPWSFPYYGNSYTTVTVGEDGAIVMGSGKNLFGSNVAFPTLSGSSADIAPLWDDLDIYNVGLGAPNGGHYSYYDAANDRFIISWENIADVSDTGTASFQVQLTPTGGISFHYADTTFGTSSDRGGSATIGIQDFTGGTSTAGNSLQIALNTAVIVDGTTAYAFLQCVDVDGDGAFAATCGGTDCNDGNPLVSPSAVETCSDGIDQDCSGLDQLTDQDLDGYSNLACGGDDCNDLSPIVNPGVDADGDGSNSCLDCDDSDLTVVPGAAEVCDGLDNDCNGLPGTLLLHGVSGNAMFGPGTNRARGGTWLASSSVALSQIGQTLDVPVGAVVQFAIYEGLTPTGTHTLLQMVPYTSPAAGLTDRYVNVNVSTVAGRYYLVAAFWTANVGYGYVSPSNYQTSSLGTQLQGWSSSLSSAPSSFATLTGTGTTQYAALIRTDGELVDGDGDGVTVCLGDCNDGSAASSPSGVEFCGDNLDNDCDGTADNIDFDLDGEIAALCSGLDCNDANALVNTSALEICDLVDGDCDGLDDTLDVDIGSVLDAPATVSSSPALAFTNTSPQTATMVMASGNASPIISLSVSVNITHTYDADITMSLLSPGGTTVLLFDERGGSANNLTNTVFSDSAATAIGSGSAPFTGTFRPEQPLSALAGEIVDGTWSLLLSDCCGGDNGLLNSWTINVTSGVVSDADGDSFIASTFCATGDCDDTNVAIFPGALEVCADTIDQDCDGSDDAGDVDLDGGTTVDCGGTDCDDSNPNVFDGSDFDLDLALGCQTDCNDLSATVYPGANEVCADGIDQDCSGADFGSGVDNDLDGESNCTDCDDFVAAVNSAATEVCGDATDNDCSGTAEDVDGDGDGALAALCGGTDCDDANALAYPGLLEVCDTFDGDCDGIEDGMDIDIGSVTNPLASMASTPALFFDDTAIVTDIVILATGYTQEILDVNVRVDITHTYDGDIVITLISPLGTRVDLSSLNGSGGNNFTNTVFDDSAATSITAGAPPYTGTFRPEGLLSALNGEAIDGVWTLELDDQFAFDSGTLNAWSVDILTGVSSDGDGDGWIGAAFCAGADCDDDVLVNANASLIFPGAVEVCADTIDQDCNGSDLLGDVDADSYIAVLCGGNDCDDGNLGVYPGAPEVCGDTLDNDCDVLTTDLSDNDGDGSDCGVDCDDANVWAFPGFYEICDDGADNDCDVSTADIGDRDNDGALCDVDCDDTNANFSPLLPELLCSGVDEDCDAATTPDVDDGDGDGFNCDVDCLDTNASVNPAAVEVACDGLDNDCDSGTEGEVDSDGDLVTCGFDCDDNEPLVFPGNPELCNDSLNNDCDVGTTDVFDTDADGSDCIVDCDDADPLTYPGAPEICEDLVDQDCDTAVDELANDAYDLDDDGAVLIGLCDFSFPFCGQDWNEVYVQSNGRVTFGFSSGEHTEGLPLFLSEAPEIAFLWNDLDPSAGGTVEVEEITGGLVITYTNLPELAVVGSENSFTATLYDDGTVNIAYGALTMVDGLTGFSCDNGGVGVPLDLSDVTFAPNQWAIGMGTEGAVYEVFTPQTNPNDLATLTLDLCLTAGDDGDSDGWTDTCGDCDDAVATTFPGATEVCADAADNDCDGTVDNADEDGDGFVDANCGGPDCDDANAAISPAATESCNAIDDDCDGSAETGSEDVDADGFLICAGDCDDGEATVNPDATEVCDQVDNDCDAAVDNGFTPDLDNDGFIDEDCAGDDCDDSNPDANPDATEICDLADNDCNGEVDEIDADGDTYLDGNCGGDDCQDGNEAVNPGAAEVPYDGVDNDCSGGDVVDADGDGFFGGDGSDCDDESAAVFPGAEELCDDSIDNDCNGGIDKGDKDLDIAADAICTACNCTTSLVDGTASGSSVMLLLSVVGLASLRRRRAA